MKKLLLITILIVETTTLWSQKGTSQIGGVVSFQSSQNCYVRFESTEGINTGDTLYVERNGELKPALVVNYISSISCASTPLDGQLTINERIVANIPEIKQRTVKKLRQETDTNLNEHPAIASEEIKEETENSENISGRLSAIGYLNLTNTPYTGYQKYRYNLSLQAMHIRNTGFSLESFVSFTHRKDYWSEIQSDIFNGLKIYDLSLSYKFNDRTKLLAGRNINPHISSMGAIDGLQFNTGYKQFFFGAIVGFRPDYSNYSFNAKLLEYGGYAGHKFIKDKKSIETTLGFIQQTNNGNTDRRFAYLQSNISLIKNLRIFLSTEVDLYKNIDSVSSTAPSLTSFYINLNYRPNKKITLNATYDARKNVIYYETFKNYLDQMLEDATRQGFQFRANYRLSKNIGVGANGGYRNRSGDLMPTQTANAYVSVNQMPFIKGYLTANTHYISNSYLNGWVYSLFYSRDILPDKLSADMNLRLVDYNLLNSSEKSLQYIGEAGIYWQITKGLSISSTYEATFENQNQWGMLYINLSQKF